MKPNLFILTNQRRLALGLLAATIAGTGLVMAQQPGRTPPKAPEPLESIPGAGSTPSVPQSLPAPPTPPLAPSPEVPGLPSAPSAGAAPVPVPESSNRFPGASGRQLVKPSRKAPRAILDQDLNADPAASASSYEAIVTEFDQQREEAAQAIFRLAGLYRQAGRMDEARTLYARILREFVDFPEMARISQKMLAERSTSAAQDFLRTVQVDDSKREELNRQVLKMLDESMALAEKQAEDSSLPPAVVSALKSQVSVTKQAKSVLDHVRQLAKNNPVPRTPPLTAVVADRLEQPAVTARPPKRAGYSNGEIDRLESEISALRQQRTLLENQGQPETASPQVVTDPRFKELKGEYESALLNANDPASQKTLDQSLEKLRRWVSSIYLPELKTTLEVKEERLNELRKRSELRTE